MTSPCRRLLPTLLLIACAPGQAADEESAPLTQPISGGVAPVAASQAASGPAAQVTRWEGAIGPQFSWSPEYHGAARQHLSITPGFFLRYGRLTFSNSGGFVTRRADDVFRGLGVDVVRSKRVRVNFSLRLDNGRRSAVSDKLAGIDNVRHTIRVRSSGTWQLAEGWKAAAGWNTDLLGRGGGNVIDAGIGHDRRLTSNIVWNFGGGVNWGDSRYMRSYYGVSTTESAVSGYRVYVPRSGLRDVGVSTGFRMEISPEWMALWGASMGKLLGPAALSPLTGSTRQWSLNGGIAWRF